MIRRRWTVWAEVAGGAVLALGLAWLLMHSWRKWTDPLIDFGRELYTPWRLANGAVLYRDVDDAYGPFSQYLNAGLFRIFGTGLTTLIWANLAVLILVTGLIYFLLRRAYGAAAAWVGCAVFLPVFAVAEYTYTGNYNFISPYAHEATHGYAVLLLLVAVLAAGMERPGCATAKPPLSSRPILLAATAGLLVGLAAVIKAEILLAAGAVVAAAGIWHWRWGARLGPSVAIFVAAACVPTAAFWVFFCRVVSPGRALAYVGRAWLNALPGSGYAADPVQRGFIGLDHPAANVWATCCAAALTLGACGAALAAAWAATRLWGRPALRALALVPVLLMGAASLSFHHWDGVARGLPLLMVAYAAWVYRAGDNPTAWLLAILGAALLARMALNARLYQFGFYQASLATVVIAAAMVHGWKSGGLLSSAPPWRFLAVVALVAPGVGWLSWVSQRWFGLRTEAVGVGPDTFYAVPSQIYPMGTLVEMTASHLRARPGEETVLVLPEGLMINYLARKRSPVPQFFLFSAATAGDREAELVQTLETRPPAWVILVSRNLEEYGVRRYGEAPGKGELLLRWVGGHYRRIGGGGGDPLDPRGCAIAVFKRQ